MHVIANLLAIFLLEKDAFSAESQDVGLTLALDEKGGFGRAREISRGNSCRGGLLRLGDAMGRRAFLGVDKGVAGVSERGGGEIFHGRLMSMGAMVMNYQWQERVMFTDRWQRRWWSYDRGRWTGRA